MKTAAQRATEWFWFGSRCHDMTERTKVKNRNTFLHVVMDGG